MCPGRHAAPTQPETDRDVCAVGEFGRPGGTEVKEDPCHDNRTVSLECHCSMTYNANAPSCRGQGLILQITLVGWIPAAIWAVYALSQYNTDKKIEKAMGGGA